MKKLISEIKIVSNSLIQNTDDELTLKIEKIKKRTKNESLDELIVEWFALVQEISFRKIGLRHFDTQLLAGLFLHKGQIVEMKTGEGKTLASTLPVSLNALNKKGVHVVTVNDYLAERDQKWMGKVYKGLGLTVGLINNNNSLQEKQKNYNCDITYVTNSELVFDYLRDNSAYNLNELVQRQFHFCVIDEIDSVLIDEARTPLILSTVKKITNKNKLYLAKAIANILIKDIHFELDEKRREINLTEIGYEETKQKLGQKTLYDPKDPWILEVLNGLKAKYIFKKNKDYIVLNNKVLIVDEFTGRIMEDRRWSLGIHEAIEIKEKVELGGGTRTKSSITYQNFFTLYPKLAGMTGTAKTTEKEFQDIYNLDVIVLPTQKPMIRKDFSDLVYQTELSKWKAVLLKAKDCFLKGQPILIGTASIEKSEFLTELFTIANIPHQVLNAKPENVARESQIVAQAGERYAVTIATNMAGRGTDIILGGNVAFKAKEKIRHYFLSKKSISEVEYLVLATEIINIPYSTGFNRLRKVYDSCHQVLYSAWKQENALIKQLGGLFVLGTERHETRRIDNQLRGRAGRQGDPGSSQFVISLEDELIKIFGGESIKRWVEFLIQDKDVPLESDLLTRSLENAQKKVELYNYDIRKNVFQYDDILNRQRKQLFEARNELLCEGQNFDNLLPSMCLESTSSQELLLRYVEHTWDDKLQNLFNSMKQKDFEDPTDIYSEYLLYKKHCKISKKKQFQFEETCLILQSKSAKNWLYSEIWIQNDLRFAHSNFYQKGLLKNTRCTLLLSIIDFFWTEHIELMSCIRETINWRAYGQQNPLIEYNIEAFKSFLLMFEQIRLSMIYYFLNNELN
jgi:preprotein translocase subunit SecA